MWLCKGRRGGYVLEPSPASECLNSSRKFPMWVIDVQDLLELDTLKPHQELLAAGKLKEHGASNGLVTFVSHEWSDFSHPDPNNHQLQALQMMIRNIRAGTVSVAHDNYSFVRFGLNRTVSLFELRLLAEGSLWIDFLCVPQACWCRTPEELAKQQAELWDAVMSLHTYVAQSSFFAILAPTQRHKSDGRLMGYNSWRRRGWCQFELAVSILLGTKPVIHIASDQLLRNMYMRNVSQLSPCCGDFTNACDREFVKDALTEVMKCEAEQLRFKENFHRLQLLDCLQSRLLRCAGECDQSPAVRKNASLASRTMFFAQIEPSKRHGWTDLHYCMARNDLEMTKTLLEQRADVNAKTLVADKDFFMRSNLTPLHIWACFPVNHELAKLLVDGRADVNSQTDGWTPLNLSIQLGSVCACRSFLQLSANVHHEIGYMRVTPLWLAVANESRDVVAVLLEAKADARHSLAGLGALHIMALLSPGVALPLLLAQDLDINEPCWFSLRAGGAFLGLSRLWDEDVKRDFPLVQGGTALHFAAARGNAPALGALLEARADVHARNARGQTVWEVFGESKYSNCSGDDLLRYLALDPKLTS